MFAFESSFDKLGMGGIVCTIINLNIARAMNIGIISFFVNRFRSEKTKIPIKTKFVMWIAGLRGAMAYALAMLSIADYGPPGEIMLALTLTYALITILIIGSMLNPILAYCGVVQGAKTEAKEEIND